jgi:hypothetical protein
MSSPSKPYRVKLYQEDANSEWVDQGVGLLKIDAGVVSVCNENSPDLLLLTYTVSAEVYHTQGDTILTWDDSAHLSYALSFADPASMKAVIAELCRLQQKDPASVTVDSQDPELLELYSPSTSNLSALLAHLSGYDKSILAAEVIDFSLVPKLRQLLLTIDLSQNGVQEDFFGVYKQLCKA